MTQPEIDTLKQRWAKEKEEWGIVREYTPEDVVSLRGTVRIEHTLSRRGADCLRRQLCEKPFIRTGGARDGNDAIQMVLGGLEAIYLSGWQTAAGGNIEGKIFPDMSIHPSTSFEFAVRQLNNGLLRADQIAAMERCKLLHERWEHVHKVKDWLVPIIVDAEAGFGGTRHMYNFVENMVLAGAAAIHAEDQQSSDKKCGHMGEKVITPTRMHIDKLKAGRLAADVHDVPLVIIARTDANSARFLSSDIDEQDHPFIHGERTREGFYQVKGGLGMAISRCLAFAPYADMLWCETSIPDIDEAREFAQKIHEAHPGKVLAYNCSPSFNWLLHFKRKYGSETKAWEKIGEFQDELAGMNYKFQFITLYGFHAHNHGMFELSRAYASEGMPAYVRLQQAEFASAEHGYTAHKHQRFAATGVFDRIDEIATGGKTSTRALKGSTEEGQF